MRWLMNSSVSILPWPVVSSVLNTSMCVSLARRRIRHTPSSSILVRSPTEALVRLSVTLSHEDRESHLKPWAKRYRTCGFKLTREKRGRKVGAHVAVPLAAAPRDRVRDGRDVEILEPLQHAVARAEPDNDARNAQQERLDPELEQLALEVVAVAVVAHLR